MLFWQQMVTAKRLIMLSVWMLRRAQILSRKISPKAFQETAKKGQEAGEVGIEGTTIEHPDEVSFQAGPSLYAHCSVDPLLGTHAWDASKRSIDAACLLEEASPEIVSQQEGLSPCDVACLTAGSLL